MRVFLVALRLFLTFCHRQMRRRHGIPDSDHRPFTVAYAAAQKVRLESATGERTRSRVGSTTPASTAGNGQAAVRQRHGITGVSYAPKFDGHIEAKTDDPLQAPYQNDLHLLLLFLVG